MTNDLEIRPYRETDEGAVACLWRLIFPDSSQWNVPEHDIWRKLSVQRELFFVAEKNGGLLGTAMAGYDGHRGWVYYVAVAPEARRQGIGAALMECVERGLAEVGCPKLNLQVRAENVGVVAFYKKLGYVIEERVSMGKRLTEAGEGSQ